MITTTIAIETANNSHASICSVGVAVFNEDVLSESLHWLVRPPAGDSYFRPDYTKMHGLTQAKVQHAPEFPAIAPQILERLTAADLVVAHIAPVDVWELGGALKHFGIPEPTLRCASTLHLAMQIWPDLPHNLGALSAHIGHDLQRHDVQSEAEVTGRVLMAMVKHVGASDPLDLCRKLDLPLLQYPFILHDIHMHGLCIPSRAALTRTPEAVLLDRERELEEMDWLASPIQNLDGDEVLHLI